jgi:hypothetical protein
MEIIPLPVPADYHSTGEPSTDSCSITCLQDNYSAWTKQKTHFPFYCCTFMAVMCLPARYLVMAALLLLHAGRLENVYLFVSQQRPNLSQYTYKAPKGYHEQIHVSHLLGCHAKFPYNKNVWIWSENSYYFRMCDILRGTLHCAEAGMQTPCNNCTCHAILPHLNACKYDFLLPDVAE